jgi:general secretion pathway protein A
LLGQPELDAKLDSDSLRQLRQRVSVRWSLEPLPPEDTVAYIKHRLQIAAGAPRDIFTPAAMREIHRRTRGIPRLINVLCDRALLIGYADRQTHLGKPAIEKAAQEIMRSGRNTSWPRGLFPALLIATSLAFSIWLGITWYGMPGPLVNAVTSSKPELDSVSAGSAADIQEPISDVTEVLR